MVFGEFGIEEIAKSQKTQSRFSANKQNLNVLSKIEC